MRKYEKRKKVLRNILNVDDSHKCLWGIIQSWVVNIRSQDISTHLVSVESESGFIADLLEEITRYATPSLQEGITMGTSRKRIHESIPQQLAEEQLKRYLESFSMIYSFCWEKDFLPMFEKFIKTMKSFRDFNMESLADFLATNEYRDMWLIVATNKDYKEESAEDRFSL